MHEEKTNRTTMYTHMHTHIHTQTHTYRDSTGNSVQPKIQDPREGYRHHCGESTSHRASTMHFPSTKHTL